MAKFIKLTTIHDTPAFINMDLIILFFQQGEGSRLFINGQDGCHVVNETPEQILELIKAAE